MTVTPKTQLPVQSVPITTKVVSWNPAHDEVHSIQLHKIKYFSNLGQVFRWFSLVSSTNRRLRKTRIYEQSSK